MTARKDFKRLVRARMRKTGEAYTAARARLLEKRSTPRPTLARSAASYAELAGTKDAALEQKTGRNWAAWVRALDRAGAESWPHSRIAKYVRETYDVSSWWSQTVTVGYERIKGLRVVGQRRDGTFETTKSKTFAVPLNQLYRAWSDRRQRAQWLDEAGLTVRSATRGKYMHITWADRTSVEVGFAKKTAAKSQVAVQHGKLKDKAAATRMKTYWEERLRALGAFLGHTPKRTV